MRILSRARTALCGLLVLGLCSLGMPAGPSALAKAETQAAQPMQTQEPTQAAQTEETAPTAQTLASSLPVQVGVDETSAEEDVAHYEPVAESGQLTMYADMEKGWFAVRNNASGCWWYSHPNDVLTDTTTTGSLRQELRSDLVVGYMFSEQSASGAVNYANSQTGPVRDKTVSVTRIPNGIQVVYDFMAIGIRVPVTYTLEAGASGEEAELKASVLCGGILEGSAFLDAKRAEGASEEELSSVQTGLLLNLWLLPSFGAQACLQDAQADTASVPEGYAFVPDGSGALITFDQSPAIESAYSKMVYGEDAALEKQTVSTVEQNILLPVFGVVRDQDAMVGIITRGEGAASIAAYKANPDCHYTGVSSRVHFRLLAGTTLYKNQSNSREVTQASDTLGFVDSYEITYRFLSGDKADYSGMAEAYRQYLLDTEQMAERTQTPAVVLDILGAADVTANFLGFSYAKTTALTSFEQAAAMVEELNAGGVDHVAVRYLGWNGGLMNRKVVTSARPLSILGGEKAFQTLKERLEAAGNPFYPDVDFLRFTKNGSGYKASRDAIQTVFGLTAGQNEYLRSTYEPSSAIAPYYLLTPGRLQEAVSAFLPSYGELGASGISLSTMSYLYYSDLGDQHPFYRAGLQDVYKALLQDMAGYDVAAQSANAYMLAAAQRVIDVPVDSSDEDIFACSVPFYQIVTHGYVATSTPAMNTAYDQQLAFLKTVETGSELYYTVMDADPTVLQTTRHNGYYNAGYSAWKDVIMQQYASYAPLLESIYDQPITEHLRLSEDVYRTVYGNGIAVTVNYGGQPYSLPDGRTVPAKDFIWTEGSADA